MHDLGVLVPIAAILAWPLSIAAKSLGRPAAPSADLARLEARLARIEQAVDAIAVEVERVAEGQRFVAATLAERRPAAVGAGVPGAAGS